MSETPTYQDRQTARVYRDATEMVNDYIRRFGSAVEVELDPLDADGYTDVRRGSATVGRRIRTSRSASRPKRWRDISSS